MAPEKDIATHHVNATTVTEDVSPAPGWTSMKTFRMKRAKESAGAPVTDGSAIGLMDADNMKNGKRGVTATAIESGSSADDALNELRSDDGLLEVEGDGHAGLGNGTTRGEAGLEEVRGDGVAYKVYKRRWFGLVQLVLLNIIVSWDVSLPRL